MSNDVQAFGTAPGTVSENERRGEPRHDAARLGKVSARLIGGSEVTLVNFSNRGVLFESDSRLLIGARASVRITTTDASVVVTGRVVRSRVKGVVNGALRYDAALALDSDLTLAIPEEPAPPPPAVEPEPAPDAANATEPVSVAADDVTAEEWPYGDPADLDEPGPVVSGSGSDDVIVELFATVPHDLAELRRLAADNQW